MTFILFLTCKQHTIQQWIPPAYIRKQDSSRTCISRLPRTGSTSYTLQLPSDSQSTLEHLQPTRQSPTPQKALLYHQSRAPHFNFTCSTALHRTQYPGPRSQPPTKHTPICDTHCGKKRGPSAGRFAVRCLADAGFTCGRGHSCRWTM
jgi:hypothetical protein